MNTSKKPRIAAHVGEYAIPPLKDLLVIGKNAPIGCIAMRKAVELLMKIPFEHIEIEDDTISDILVRQQLLRRISRAELIDFTLAQMKPLMGGEEILHAQLDISIFLTESG